LTSEASYRDWKIWAYKAWVAGKLAVEGSIKGLRTCNRCYIYFYSDSGAQHFDDLRLRFVHVFNEAEAVARGQILTDNKASPAD
jgi:hypothetical protein